MKRADNSQMLLLAAERTASLASLLGTELDTVATFTGNINTRHTVAEATHCFLLSSANKAVFQLA